MSAHISDPWLCDDVDDRQQKPDEKLAHHWPREQLTGQLALMLWLALAILLRSLG